MTFTFNEISGLVFFICYLALLCICFAGLQRYDEKCPVHQNSDNCAHRKKDKGK